MSLHRQFQKAKSSGPQLKLTADILSVALEGFEVQKNRIDARMAEISQMLDGGHAA